MSTNFNVGIPTETRNSSRVLKPPGGGHSNIFAPPEEKTRQPRPKNNQQNSEMMCEIMGKQPEPIPERKISNEPAPAPAPAPAPQNNVESAPLPDVVSKSVENGTPSPVENSAPKQSQEFFKTASVERSDISSNRTKVPPGGFSSGFW